MEVTREFKPEALRSDEIVELLYSLLRDEGPSLVADSKQVPPARKADLLSPAPGVSNGHDQ